MAIDRTAARAGLEGEDAYLAEWRRVTRDCADDLSAEAAAEAARLEAEYPAERLHRLVATHGLAQPTDDGRPEPATGEEPG